MANPAWKKLERKVAKLFGTRRTPLSGRMSGHHTASDTLHPSLYIECKLLSGDRGPGAAAFRIWERVVKEAKKERKLPVLVMHKRDSRVEFAALPLDVAAHLLNEHFDRCETGG